MQKLRHLSIIMDGNGRWAEKKQRSRSYGHFSGSKKAFEMIDHVSRLGTNTISTLSLFAFSIENWQRPEAEVNLLMKLIAHSLKRKRRFLLDRNIRLHVIGDKTGLPASIVNEISETEAATSGSTGLDLIIAVNYSGQYDICQAVRRLAKAQADLSSITSLDLESFLQTAKFPDPDLLIRTGGESRLSNFFLWQSAYSEIHFEQKFWPDFQVADLEKHLTTFFKAERRFGKTSAQVLER